jgi:hypothetical protein
VAGSRGDRSADRDEPNRVLGFPLPAGPRARDNMDPRDREAEASGPGGKDDGAARHTESQRVLGIPVDWFRSIAAATLRRRG